MIPLIDIALVLLIIFMVISPILVESQLKVNLPKVTSASNAEEKAFKISVAKGGGLAFQNQVLNRAQLRTKLTALLPKGHHASILIQADKEAAFEDVVYVMDLSKQLGVEKLGISVIPENNGAS
jgi:biopolymer transport protein ExbD